MDSVPITILDAVTEWETSICLATGESGDYCCGLPIPIIWLNGDAQSAADVCKCPRHAVESVPPSARGERVAELMRLHRAWDALRISDPRVHQGALRCLPGLYPTLFGQRLGTWEGVNVDLYYVRGLSKLSRDAVTQSGLTERPLFDVQAMPPDSGEAERGVPPADPSASVVSVHLAIGLWSPRYPDLHTLRAWQAANPSGDYQFVQFGSAPDRTREKLYRIADSLLTGKSAGGVATLASRKDELRLGLIQKADGYLGTRGCQPAVTAKTFAEVIDMPIATLYRHLRESGLVSWTNFKKRYLIDSEQCRNARSGRRRTT